MINAPNFDSQSIKLLANSARDCSQQNSFCGLERKKHLLVHVGDKKKTQEHRFHGFRLQLKETKQHNQDL